MSNKKSFSYGVVYWVSIIITLIICLIYYVRAPDFLVFNLIFIFCGILCLYNIAFSVLKKDTLVIKEGKITKINALFMKKEIVLSDYSSIKLVDGIMKKIVATNTKTNFIEVILYNLYNVDLDDIYQLIIEETRQLNK